MILVDGLFQGCYVMLQGLEARVINVVGIPYTRTEVVYGPIPILNLYRPGRHRRADFPDVL
jgi:hypothetical protein